MAATLREVEVAECWQPYDLSCYIDTAVRRWTTSDRRLKPAHRTPENRVRDLLRGLREAQGDDLIYEEPGWLEHVAERFGTVLLAADHPNSNSADRGLPGPS